MADVTIKISRNMNIKQLRNKQHDILRAVVEIEKRIVELEEKQAKKNEKTTKIKK